MITIQSTVRQFCLLAATLLFSSPGLAADAKPPVADDTRAYFEVLRSQFNTDKVATVNQVLKLTAVEAEKFWPIYRQYEKELASLADRRLELMREFFREYSKGGLTEESSKTMAKKWLRNLEDRTALWKKYHQRISKGVSAIRAAQFLQLEHQIALLIDLSIASEMPALAPGGRPPTK